MKQRIQQKKFVAVFPLGKFKTSDVSTEVDSCDICHVTLPNVF